MNMIDYYVHDFRFNFCNVLVHCDQILLLITHLWINLLRRVPPDKWIYQEEHGEDRQNSRILCDSTVTSSTEWGNVLPPDYFDSSFRYLYSIQLSQCVKIASIFIISSCWIVFHNKCTRSTSLQVTTHSFNYKSTRWFDYIWWSCWFDNCELWFTASIINELPGSTRYGTWTCWFDNCELVGSVTNY